MKQLKGTRGTWPTCIFAEMAHFGQKIAMIIM